MMELNENKFNELMALSDKTEQEKIEWMITFHRAYIANMKTSVYEAKRQIAVWEKRLLSLENELRELKKENNR